MLQTNQGLPLKRPFQKREVLFHTETIRSILRFTHGSSLRKVYWMPYPALTGLGTKMLASRTGLFSKFVYNPYIQRRTQSKNTSEIGFKERREAIGLSAFHEKVKKEIRAIKSLFKNNSKGAI